MCCMCMCPTYHGVHEKGVLSVHSLYLHYFYLSLCTQSSQRTLFRKTAVLERQLTIHIHFLDTQITFLGDIAALPQRVCGVKGGKSLENIWGAATR